MKTTIKEGYSKLMVMKSGAGFYIGRYYTEADGFTGPGSRESGYFGTKKEAQTSLDKMNFEVRDCMENNHAYETGELEKPVTK